ncbi:hypothetical protein CkaCkLH20_09907 [Colletotrichum karsti]|uniref:Protein kinase domain-containing protein n=1 Tax=Colletotrichum karsti TaxID=1095194 RepID=A0A9P6LGN9_9PEZI|nr:uncharacterized protein CkaCkLH20_09907 [Colletotrichum karsti]KAF9872728.1 hypothetical protein CkaCkLH20_09907 [Colletotrichum karsti]
MENLLHYEVASWIVHETENDCTLIIRANNGRAFYCDIDPSRFVHSPKLTDKYLKCIEVLRSGDECEEYDLYDDEEACDWLSKLFAPLINQLAPAPSPVPEHGRPNLSQYLFPEGFSCDLTATEEVARPYHEKTRGNGLCGPGVRVGDEFLRGLDEWTRSYDPSQVDILYNRPKDVLIKPPSKVVVDAGNGDMVTCYFKEFRSGSDPDQVKREIMTLEKIARAQIPLAPKAWICRMHGVVRDGNMLMGMLLSWIDTRGVLSRAEAEISSSALRQRWREQITTSLGMLHREGIIWGDAKAENILIDRGDNAWIIDFGGSYTPGWVDKDKAETLEGDKQGLEKILSFL